MNVELVAQMFKNYQSNVLFHLEGLDDPTIRLEAIIDRLCSNGQLEGAIIRSRHKWGW